MTGPRGEGGVATELEWSKYALAHAERIGWTIGIEHYRERVLAAEYEAWATGDLSEISDKAMCHGSENSRRSHADVCQPPAPGGEGEAS